jgi:hypothetical protein
MLEVGRCAACWARHHVASGVEEDEGRKFELLSARVRGWERHLTLWREKNHYLNTIMV